MTEEGERKPNFGLWFLIAGALCTVIGRKIPHSCKVTKMCPPLKFCKGMSRPGSWYDAIAGNIFSLEECARS